MTEAISRRDAAGGGAWPRRLGRVLPWAAYLACVAALAGLYGVMILQQRERVRMHTAVIGAHIAHHFESDLAARTEAIGYLAQHWSELYRHRANRFDRNRDEMATWFPDVHGLVWVDRDGAAWTTYGLQQRYTPAGLPIGFAWGAGLPEPLIAAEREGGMAALHDPAHPGEIALCWPLCGLDDGPDGFLVATLSLADLAGVAIEGPAREEDFAFAVRSGAGHYAMLTGPVHLLSHSPYLWREALTLADARFDLELAPPHGTVVALGTPGLWFLPIVGLAAALLIAGFLWVLPLREAALAQSEQRLRQTIDLLPHILFVRDAGGRILLANQACGEAFGLPPSAVVGRTIGELHPFRDEVEVLNAGDRSVLRTGRAEASAAAPFSDRFGRRRFLEFSRLPIRWPGAAAPALLGVAIDVTERVESERELEGYRSHLEELVRARTAALQRAQDELLRQEKLAALGRLMATVSHELRNPLGTIATALFSIQRSLRSGAVAPAQRALERAERNIRRCEAIIEELFDYARTQPLQSQLLAFDAWLTPVLEEYPLPEGMRLETQLEAPGVAAFDPARLRRCIVNLLDNACHALAEARPPDAPPPRVRIVTRVRDERLTVCIADNGPGVPAADRERVFEPLYSTRAFGVGLGLAIVRQIVQQHGGTIALLDNPGGGLMVLLSLPPAPAGAAG